MEVKSNALTFKVPRSKEIPSKLLQSKNADKVDEVLLLEDVQVPGCETSVEVYINLPEADAETLPVVAEYAGHFYCISPRTMDVRLSIGNNIQLLGLQDASEFTVTIVPKGKDKHIAIPFKGAKHMYA